MTDEKEVLQEHFWCEKQENLLVRWAKAAGYRWLHNHTIVLQKQHDYLSYPSIVIASITGVGGFAVLNPSGNEDASVGMKNRIIIIQYFFAFLNVLGGILTSISKFSQSANLAEAHSVMCVQYSKFYRNIDMELSLDVQHREDVLEFVQKAGVDYDRLLRRTRYSGYFYQGVQSRISRQRKQAGCMQWSQYYHGDDASTISTSNQYQVGKVNMKFRRKSDDYPDIILLKYNKE